MLKQILMVTDSSQFINNSAFYRDAFLFFMLCTLDHKEFDLVDEYPAVLPSTGLTLTLREVLSMLPFHIATVDEKSTRCKLVRGQYSIGVLQSITKNYHQDLAFTFLKLRNPTSLDVDTLFELVIVKTIITGSQIRSRDTWANVFPFFKDTFVGNASIQSLGVDDCHSLPKVTKVTAVRQHFAQMERQGLYITDQSSHSTNIHHRILPNVIVSYAVKATEPIGISSLSDEIDKAGHDDSFQHVLILMATNLTKELLFLVPNNYVVLNTGEYISYTKFLLRRVDNIPVSLIIETGINVVLTKVDTDITVRGKEMQIVKIDGEVFETSLQIGDIPSEFGTDDKEQFTVAERMQVVLINPSWLPSVVGEQAMTALAELTRTRRDKSIAAKAYYNYIQSTNLPAGDLSSKRRRSDNDEREQRGDKLRLIIKKEGDDSKRNSRYRLVSSLPELITAIQKLAKRTDKPPTLTNNDGGLIESEDDFAALTQQDLVNYSFE
jgi:hypothetical protein